MNELVQMLLDNTRDWSALADMIEAAIPSAGLRAALLAEIAARRSQPPPPP